MSLRTIEEREAMGVSARDAVALASHAEWSPAADRADPVSLLQAQNAQRIPWLVPVRHARMRVSPFTFYRGTASIMAADLAHTPVSGFDVQVGGDAHLLNFGAYASPERTLVFDANDFDETLRGPWEWDVKRLAVSFFIACRHRGLDTAASRAITTRVVRSYRRSMQGFGEMRFLDLWYEHTDMRDLRRLGRASVEDLDRRVKRFEKKAKSKNSLHALRKLTERVDQRPRIRTDRPVLVPLREVHPDQQPDEIEANVRKALADYCASLRDDRRHLVEQYELVDIALKVVGVGSVGTACYVLLFEGRDDNDPLFLQAKEANASVLEAHLEPSPYGHHGERVVQGRRHIQAQSDIFLGWATGQAGKHFYVRQLRDWKRSFDVEAAEPDLLGFYADVCGHVMARGHARSGDPVAIGAYMGTTSGFDRAIVAFCERYVHQVDEDYDRFESRIADGELPVQDDF